jgi:valyl-tRNA synthetase
VWSWWQAGSVHQSAWPTPAEVTRDLGGPDMDAAAVLEQTVAALAEVRRVRALEKRGGKSVIREAVIPASCQRLAAQDFRAALHIETLRFDEVPQPVLAFAEEPTA